MKDKQIIIQIYSDFDDNDKFIDDIAKILLDKKLICRMAYYNGINRTEYISEFD